MSGPSRHPTRRTRSTSSSPSKAASRSRSTASGCHRSTWWIGCTTSAERMGSGASTTSRTASSASRAGRSTRPRRRPSCMPPIGRSRASPCRATPSGSTGSWPTSWHDSSTTACGSAPCHATCAPTWRRRSASVSGDVRVRLDHGQAVVAGRQSPLSLYDKSLATYDEGDAFDHASAVGFIEIFGLPLRVEAARHGAVGKHHGAAWSWTDPLLTDLPTTVTDPEPAAV